MDEQVYPAEPVFPEQLAGARQPLGLDRARRCSAELRAEAQAARAVEPVPAGRARRRADQPAVRAARRDHRPQPALAPAALNCSAPDTGNMEVLAMFGTDEQQKRWLEPLLDGEIRSAFAMTEPDVASSDATNIATRIERDGDEYVINGRKWWITGAMNPDAKIFIVMGKTDPSADRHRQQSMILVPRDTPGVDDRARHAGLRLRRPRARRPRRDRVQRRPGARPPT